MKKRKTTHIPYHTVGYTSLILEEVFHDLRKAKWRRTFQKFGQVTYCGLRVYTEEKLDASGKATCPSCNANAGLDILANT